jgi:4-hydroxy-tetrahydrodipicolinate reductase
MTTTRTAVAIAGAAGRMGRALIQASAELDGMACVAALEYPGHQALGMDAGMLAGIEPNQIILSDDAPGCANNADVWIEFSIPEPTLEHLAICVEHKVAMVIGTTGIDAAGKAAIAQAAKIIPVVFAPNMSVGVTLSFKLIELAAEILGAESDIEIIEAHHRHKIDAPSGTAVRMGEIVAQALGRNLEDCAVYGRQGRTGARERATIGFETIRGGDIVGEHTVMFAAEGERLEITHRSHTRNNFAYGALRAARWLLGREPGLYDMPDVLGLTSR